jgi:hypothetical protein
MSSKFKFLMDCRIVLESVVSLGVPRTATLNHLKAKDFTGLRSLSAV